MKWTAVWALERPLGWEWTVRANRRLAHRIGGPKRYVEPGHLIRLPGSCLRDDRLVPLPIVVERLTDGLYTARQVVGNLPDAPDADAWRRHAAA